MKSDPVVRTDADLLRVVRYGLKAIDRCKTLYIGSRTNLHESEKGDRYIRYLRMLQIQSMIPLRSIAFASGNGIPIVNHALRRAREKLKQETGPLDDGTYGGIADLWAKLMDDLGHKRFAKPVIR